MKISQDRTAAANRAPVVTSFAGTTPSALLPSPATIAAMSGRNTTKRITRR
jgi:hypothetical protein